MLVFFERILKKKLKMITLEQAIINKYGFIPSDSIKESIKYTKSFHLASFGPAT